MGNIIIKNFAENQSLTVRSDIGQLVSLTQINGSILFQFSMTPAQAREMAAALVAHADALEA